MMDIAVKAQLQSSTACCPWHGMGRRQGDELGEMFGVTNGNLHLMLRHHHSKPSNLDVAH